MLWVVNRMQGQELMDKFVTSKITELFIVMRKIPIEELASLNKIKKNKCEDRN